MLLANVKTLIKSSQRQRVSTNFSHEKIEPIALHSRDISNIKSARKMCFCRRYIMGNRKLKKATFQFTPSYEHEDRRHKWRHLVEKYGLDRIKGHLAKVRYFIKW